MSLRHTLELQTSVGRGCMRSQTLLSLKKDTLTRLDHLVPIKRNLKMKQDTLPSRGAPNSHSKAGEKRKDFSSYSFLSAQYHSLREKQQLLPSLQGVMENGMCVLHPTFQGAEHYLEGWSLSHDSEHKCKPAYCRMGEGNQQQSMHHRTCSFSHEEKRRVEQGPNVMISQREDQEILSCLTQISTLLEHRRF